MFFRDWGKAGEDALPCFYIAGILKPLSFEDFGVG